MLQIAIGETHVVIRNPTSGNCCVLWSNWRISYDKSWEVMAHGTTIINVPDEALELFFQFLQKWR